MLRFAEEEDGLMGLGAAVGDGFGHGIGFMPDDLLPEIPAVGAEGEGDHPRDAAEVFGLEAGTLPTVGLLRIEGCTRAFLQSIFVPGAALLSTMITVAEDNPESSV